MGYWRVQLPPPSLCFAIKNKMNKISNEIAYGIVFNQGWRLPPDREYEDDRMKELAIRLDKLNSELDEVYKEISKLHTAKFRLLIDTDNDYKITIHGTEIYSRDYISFSSLWALEHEIKHCVIEPDDAFMRDLLNQALESIKKGEDFSFSGNQVVELEKF